MTAKQPGSQALRNPEYKLLRNLGAYHNLRERFNFCSVDREDRQELLQRVMAGTVEQMEGLSPQYNRLKKHLALAGIEVEYADQQATFGFDRPNGRVLKLARPVPHPWFGSRLMDEVGLPVIAGGTTDDLLPSGTVPSQHDGSWWTDEGWQIDASLVRACQQLTAANQHLLRLLSRGVTELQVTQACWQLEQRLRDYLNQLVSRKEVSFYSRTFFSGRAVIEPDIDLSYYHVGLPDEMAWRLFRPLLVNRLGPAEAINERPAEAAAALDQLMAESWVIVYRAPAIRETAFIACRPVRHPHNSIHIDPILCTPMNADFDGDQVAVFLPLTAAAQQEAGQTLCLEVHLQNNPNLLSSLVPALAPMWGLASLSLTSAGRTKIEELIGTSVETPMGYLTRGALHLALKEIWQLQGSSEALKTIERLMQLGFEVAKASGASISPFLGASLRREPKPKTQDNEGWILYTEQLKQQLESWSDFSDHDLGVQMLAIKSGARGSIKPLAEMVIRRGGNGIIRHGYRDGIRPQELRAVAHRHWQGLVNVVTETTKRYQESKQLDVDGFSVFHRAMRSPLPGTVFASAAANAEIDPLLDIDSRLFLGLPVEDLISQP